MKLTKSEVWHTFAGGTFAAIGKHSYQAITTIGDYQIDPISSQTNSNCHVGYRVHFVNKLGKISGGGLWNQLHYLTTLPKARKSCQEHMEKHQGELVKQSLPGYRKLTEQVMAEWSAAEACIGKYVNLDQDTLDSLVGLPNKVLRENIRSMLGRK